MVAINAKGQYWLNTQSQNMLTEIIGMELIEAANYFRHRIRTELTRKGKVTCAFPGGDNVSGDNYEINTPNGTLSITIVLDAVQGSSLIHFINLNKPVGVVSSDLEINIPKYTNRRISTLLVEENGRRYLYSRGKFAVYRSHIPMAEAIDYFKKQYGNVEPLIQPKGIRYVIKIADLESPDLFDQIALFTHNVLTFKKQYR